MATKKSGLGRGLNALLPPSSSSESSKPAPAKKAEKKPAKKAATKKKTTSGAKKPAKAATPASETGPLSDTPREIPVHLIVANPYQPRERFEEEALEELAASIKEMGVLSPLLVRKIKDGTGYQLIAGERRFRASQRVGLKKVPVIIRELTDLEALEIALVENLQRRDLNIIEEAEGYQRLADEFAMTQEAIATRVGKARATIANAMRLLSLSPEVREMVADGRLTAGHAKALLGLEIEAEQEQLAHEAVRERWSVREMERQVKRRLQPPETTPASSAKVDIPAEHVQYLTDKLHQRFGTIVRLTPTQSLANGKKTRGKLEIDFFSNDDLDRVLEILGLAEDF